MQTLFATGKWVDAKTGALSEDGEQLANALAVEVPSVTVRPLGWSAEAELEAADVLATIRSQGVPRDAKVLVVGGGMGTFRTTLATPKLFRSGCSPFGFRHGTDEERMGAITAVLAGEIPDLVVVTSGVYLRLSQDDPNWSIPEKTQIAAMTLTNWTEEQSTHFHQRPYGVVPKGTFFPEAIHGVSLVGLRSYVSEGELRKVTWVRGLPTIGPTFVSPHGREVVIDCGSGECKRVSVKTGCPGNIVKHGGTVESAISAVQAAISTI